MKKIYIIAAVLAIALTACSFFNSDSKTSYQCQVTIEGGSKRATVSPTGTVVEDDNGKTVEITWSSPNYDYMLVEGERFENLAAEGENSVFIIPFKEYDTAFSVIADTTAMSKPHEIEYKLTVFSYDYKGDVAENDDKADEESNNTGYDLGNLEHKGSLKLDYATGFSIDYYEDALGQQYTFIDIKGIKGGNSNQYFLMTPPEGDKQISISENVTPIVNTNQTYLVSTSVMDLLVGIDALSNVKFTGTKASDWDILEAKEAIKAKDIIYAGKYSAPDYELLVSEGCNLAIENTMIYHNPETKEKLLELGIPVLVEQSSYENNPLGRLEWIKLYGAIYGKDTEAKKLFDEQVKRVKAVENIEATGKTVAFFSINSNGQIVIRKPGDYITHMIDMAGGKYVPNDITSDETNALSTMKITTEDFYIKAVDADYLIYNSTIEGEVLTIDELKDMEATLGDFKAVKNENVYCLREGYFQKTTNVAEFIEELHSILDGSFNGGKCFFKIEE